MKSLIDELFKCECEIHLKYGGKDDKILLKGKKTDLLVGFCFLANKLKENGIEEEELKMAFELGMRKDEEVKNIAEKKLKTLLDKLF